MYQYKTISPAELTDAEAAAWEALCIATPEFRSPLLGPGFARLVGRRRSDAEVLVVAQGHEPVAFFAYHRRPGRLARPIGAPFSDVQAVVSRAGGLFTGADLLRAARVDRFKYQALVDPYHRFPHDADTVDLSFTIDLVGDRGELTPPPLAVSRSDLKKWARSASRLAESHGAVRVVLSDERAASLETVFGWKSAQLVRNGLQDFLAPRWVHGMMQDAFALTSGPFRGRLMTLWAGDTLLAGRFGVEANAVFHPWVSAYDPALAEYTPGNLLLWKALQALPSVGVRAVELSTGLGEHKRRFATREEPLRAGAFELTPHIRYAGPASEDRGALARLSRRFDQIALLEPSWPMRAASVITALARAPRRNRGLAKAG